VGRRVRFAIDPGRPATLRGGRASNPVTPQCVLKRKKTVMPENTLCPRCDTANAPDATFCIACAAPLSAAAEPPRELRAPAQAAPVRRCPSCGTANPPGSRFCVLCGVSLDHPPTTPRGITMAPAPALAAAGGPTIHQHVYVTHMAQPELPLVVRALWFFFIGLPLGFAWVVAAWLFNLTLIGLPIGLWMLSMMPQVMTLRQQRPQPPRPPAHSATSVAVRAVYFVLIGWWLSLLWMLAAWGIAATVIGLPLSFMMFERTSTVLTLSDA